MNEDDDLPVLTQILRTGHADREVAAPPLEQAVDALDPRSVARRTMNEDPLVIGHGSVGVAVEDLVPQFDVSPPMFAFDGAVKPPDEAAPHPADAFVLSQDHDAPQALGASYDEPEYSATPPEPPPADTTPVADRVRDAVLERLRARIDTQLDARIAQAIHVELETALAQLQGSLRLQLNEALKDVVGRAVDEEMARIAVQSAIDRR